jgi:two-component system response regulator DevR
MNEQDRVTLYIVDDHELVREGLRTLVEDAGYAVVGQAGTVDDAVEGIVQLRPSIAIVDIRLHDGSGVDVCRRVGPRAPETRCLMLTSYDDDDALFASIEAGAAGYLLKQIRNLDLVDAIRRVANGERLLDQDATARVFDRLRFGPRTDDPRLDGLNVSERLVLSFLTQGLSNKEIGDRMHLAEKTVKNYVSRVLRALGMRSRTQAALYASANPLLKDLAPTNSPGAPFAAIPPQRDRARGKAQGMRPR